MDEFAQKKCMGCNRMVAAEERLELTRDWIKDLSLDIKTIGDKLDRLNNELALMREKFAKHIGMWIGGALVVSHLIDLFG